MGGTVETVKECVREYLAQPATYYPYFILADETMVYCQLVTELSSFFKVIHVSDYCQEDSFPDYGRLFDVDELANDAVLYLGLGEAAWLQGNENIIQKFIQKGCHRKTVVLCRGIYQLLKHISELEPKFCRFLLLFESSNGVVVQQLSRELGIKTDAMGFRSLLRILEKGKEDTVQVVSDLNLAHVSYQDNPYELICEDKPDFPLEEAELTFEQWRDYLVHPEDENVNSVFDWRTYIALKQGRNRNRYLQFVVKRVRTASEYRKEVIDGLLHIKHTDKQFDELYSCRKQLLMGLADSDISEYVLNTKSMGKDRVFYLTDNTMKERKAIMDIMHEQERIFPDLEHIYGTLMAYMKPYSFSVKNGELLTEYFQRYKELKVLNIRDEEFIAKVQELAQPGKRVYNSLETRGAVLENMQEENTFLYWIDALGVEFLSYIQYRASLNGLRLKINIARADLPTLTDVNKGFYDCWIGEKSKVTELDDLIHGTSNAHENDQQSAAPYYLIRELVIIDEVLDSAKTMMKSHECKQVIITSDHGASRLAVTYQNENQHEMATKGEHSGRCCPCNEVDKRPDCASEENDYWVLANYDRFRGGRMSSVEVHGGASLEEVIIPVISLTLTENNVYIIPENTTLKYDYKDLEPVFIFSIPYDTERFSVHVDGKVYHAHRNRQGKYQAALSGMKKEGNYLLEVYEEDNMLGQFEIKIESASAGTGNEGFDFFD